MRRPFQLFMLIVGVMVTGLILFIQSPQFARVFKSVISRYIPSNLGIEADFTEFAVKIFPPGVSIRNPKIVVQKHNLAGLPPGSSVSAERIDLNFRPFQMFTGNIRVHEVEVINGDVHFVLAEPAPALAQNRKLLRMDVHWDELFQVHAEAVSLVNTKVRVDSPASKFSASFVAKSLRLGQWLGKGGLGYELSVELRDIESTYLKSTSFPEKLDGVRALAHVNATGIQIESLDVDLNGIAGHASGSIRGNILSAKSLILDSAVELHAGAKDILTIIRQDDLDGDGSISFNGKIRGSLDKLAETFKAEGSILASGLRYKAWRAKSVEVTGSYSAQEGEVALTHGLITAPEQPRIPGKQGASGGKVEILPFQMQMSSKTPLIVPVRLEDAHVHWLGAIALKQVFPLEFRASGPVEVTYLPGKNWQVQTKVALQISNLILDNQKLDQIKPLHQIIKAPKLSVEGVLLADKAGVYPQGMILSGAHSRIKTTGKIDFSTGYDITGTGTVDLADVPEIAQNEIRGSGTLAVHIHGPTTRTIIDFDTDLKNGYYLKMGLGNVQGRITWDDDPDDLLFSKVKFTRGDTVYFADGKLALGKNEYIALNVQVPQGNIHDFFDVFHELVKDLWWFPSSLNGPIKGDVRITGGVSTKELEVLASLSGSNWEYLGEKFKSVDLIGGFDKGRYHISDFKATKRSGSFQGHISYNSQNQVDWSLGAQNLNLSDLDHLAQLDVPIRGKLTVDSTGKTSSDGRIMSTTVIAVPELAIRGAVMAPSTLSVGSSGGVMKISANALGGQGVVESTYNSDSQAISTVHAELRKLDFSPVLLLINSKLIQDKGLASSASGKLDLNFHAGEVEKANGLVEISEYILAKTDSRFALTHPVSFKIEEGSFDLNELSLRGPTGEATLNLRGRKANLEGEVNGTLDLAVATFFTSSVSQAQGVAKLDFAIGGNLKTPSIFGRASLDGAGFRVPSIESPFENVTGSFLVRQNVLTVQNLESDLSGGRVFGEGTIELFADRYPLLALKGSLSGSKLKVYPFQYAKAHGNVSVTGSEPPYLIAGTVVIDSALSKEKVFNQKQGEGLKTLQYTPVAHLQGESGSSRFKLKLDVSAERNIFVQNDLFDAELKGHFTIVNTLEVPRILGTAELVQGRMLFKDRSFQIVSAASTFDNPTVLDPIFNLNATTDVNGTKILLLVSGRLSNLKIDLNSNPVLPESDILSLLALGYTSSETRRLSATDRSVFEQGEAASLLLQSLDFNREVQNKTGLQIQLDESVNNQVGQSIFRPQTQGESAAAPKIVIRKKIGKNIGLSYGSTVGIGTNNQKEVNAELQVTPGFSVIGVWDNLETVDTSEKTSSYGLDLKLQKRFK